jgi:hypothetical protein
MNWPWVGRRVYEEVCVERDRLRAQNDKLTEHLTRMDRTEHGLHEVPREQRPPVEPMPREIMEYINGFAFPAFRKQMRDTAYRRRARGEPWAAIAASLKSEDEDVPVVQEQPT